MDKSEAHGIPTLKTSSNTSSSVNSLHHNIPLTPQNSYADFKLDQIYNLPSLNNKETVELIQKKREQLIGGTIENLDSGVSSVPFTPPNSYIGGSYGQSSLKNISEAELHGKLSSVHVMDKNTESDIDSTNTGIIGSFSEEDIHFTDDNSHVKGSKYNMALKENSEMHENNNPEKPNSKGLEKKMYHGANEMDIANQITKDVILCALQCYKSGYNGIALPPSPELELTSTKGPRVKKLPGAKNRCRFDLERQHSNDSSSVSSSSEISKSIEDLILHFGEAHSGDETETNEGLNYSCITAAQRQGVKKPSHDDNVEPDQAKLAKLIVDQAIKAAVHIYSQEEHEWSESKTSLNNERPNSLRKKRIQPNHQFLEGSDEMEDSSLANMDLTTPEGLQTPETIGGGIEGELNLGVSHDAVAAGGSAMKKEGQDEDEAINEQKWKTITLQGKTKKIDMVVIEPYKKVLSHGGSFGTGLNSIIVFCGCYLPDRSRKDYNYVMDNLFLYVLSTLEMLVVEDYAIVYFHGATPRQRMPGLMWLKRCYDMIDRRLRKNCKSLMIVHPTLWLKTIVLMTRPFVSSKFAAKLHYVKNLQQLRTLVPMDHIFVPDEVKQFDDLHFPSPPPQTS